METKEQLIERLKRCGCCKAVVDQLEQGTVQEEEPCVLAMLKECQKEHMHEFEEACRQIDCIDYLIYEVEKKGCR